MEIKPRTKYNLPTFNKLYINDNFVILHLQIIYQKYKEGASAYDLVALEY